MIRKITEKDTTEVMTLWVKGNFKAHSFINKEYWIDKFNEVKEKYLLNSETYIFEENKEIVGFISIINNDFIGAVFIKPNFQRKGIGRMLINYCKERKEKLQLHVYQNNVNATIFYLAMRFKNIGVQIDENTGEKEYVMEWVR